MKVSFHGHSVVKIEAGGKQILIDPFITGNGLTDLSVEDVKPDYILITHAHDDHLGDTVSLAKEHDALVISNFELSLYLEEKGIKTHGMSIGGAYDFDFGRVKLTQAFHGTGFMEDGRIVYGGMPAGILLTAEGKTIFHAGDTGLFSDMKLIGDRHPIDLAFIPIGDNFTMGPEDAAEAVRYLHPKQAVPIHYDTFPPIKQDPVRFASLCDGETTVTILKPGDALTL